MDNQDFDFFDYDLQSASARGSEMSLLNPLTSKATGVLFKVYGADAREYRVELRRIHDQIGLEPGLEPTDEDDRMLLQRAREASAAIHGWSGVKVRGEAVDYSRDEALKLLVAYPWAADQVISYINKRGNFQRT